MMDIPMRYDFNNTLSQQLNLKELVNFAKALGLHLRHQLTQAYSQLHSMPHWQVIALRGDLGAGKTTFSQAFIQSLLPDSFPQSPTFSLIHPYVVPLLSPYNDKKWCIDLYHMDLYRLKTLEEAYSIGLEEYFYGGLCLVEWPERVESLLPTTRIDISLDFIKDKEDHRQLTYNYFK